MANKYDLKTVVISATANTAGVHNIGSGSAAIPAGKTRFLTYIRAEKTDPIATVATALTTAVAAVSAATNLSMISAATASAQIALPIGFPKMSVTGEAVPAKIIDTSIPDRPDIDHPILALAGGASAFMVLQVKAAGPAARIFAQYYDE